MTQRRVSTSKGWQVKCPFCGGSVKCHPLNANMPWCVHCRIEWYESRDGRFYVFDDKRKTPRYAWGKALNASGGMSLGTVDIKKPKGSKP